MFLFLSSHSWLSPATTFRSSWHYRASLARMDSIDPDVIRVDGGLHFNHRFAAPNIWEVDVDEDLIDEAGRIFSDGAPFASATAEGEPYETIDTSVGPFFLQRINWKSDACWISVDDMASYNAFHSIFTRMRLSERFAELFPHGVRLYSAFYVVRSHCDAHNFHVDYKPEAGVDALTLIAPLRDYRERDSFQLSYVAHEGARCALPTTTHLHAHTACTASFGHASFPSPIDSFRARLRPTRLRKDGLLDEGEPGSEVRRYTYKKGKAVVFGSKFMHSTEPGAGRDGETHAYLCFTFGTTDQRAWPQVRPRTSNCCGDAATIAHVQKPSMIDDGHYSRATLTLMRRFPGRSGRNHAWW